MLIKAAVNGARRAAEHPALPLTPEDLARAARESVAGGAGAIHFHVRGRDGAESLNGEDLERELRAIRSAIPGVGVGISTGAWIIPDPEARLRAVSGWTMLPDFASVNFHEEGAVALAERLLSLGVQVEAGLIEVASAEKLGRSGLARRCLRVLLEPQEQDIESALRTVDRIESALDEAGIAVRRLLHGTERTVWALIDAAASRGYDTRVGLEDTLVMAGGEPARDNAALVGEACRRRDLRIRSDRER